MYWRAGGRKNLPSQGRKSYSYGGLDDVVDLEALAAFTAVDSDADDDDNDDDDSTAFAAGMSAQARWEGPGQAGWYTSQCRCLLS